MSSSPGSLLHMAAAFVGARSVFRVIPTWAGRRFGSLCLGRLLSSSIVCVVSDVSESSFSRVTLWRGCHLRLAAGLARSGPCEGSSSGGYNPVGIHLAGCFSPHSSGPSPGPTRAPAASGSIPWLWGPVAVHPASWRSAGESCRRGSGRASGHRSLVIVVGSGRCFPTRGSG